MIYVGTGGCASVVGDEFRELGVAAGTVTRACPGSSAWRGGSFVPFPPPPPPPPGPGSRSHTIRGIGGSDWTAARATGPLPARIASSNTATIAMWDASDATNAGPMWRRINTNSLDDVRARLVCCPLVSRLRTGGLLTRFRARRRGGRRPHRQELHLRRHRG